MSKDCGTASTYHRGTYTFRHEGLAQCLAMAISVESPNRQRLYDIYRDADVDAHLSGCVEQRKGFVMARSFKIIDKNENVKDDALHYFNQSWFKQLLRLALDSIYWGHSLIELGDITKDGDGCPCFNGVKLINRKYVIPEYGRVITDLGMDWTTGIDYHQPPFTDWLIEAGQPDDLGLYLKAAAHTIPKRTRLPSGTHSVKSLVCLCALATPPSVTKRSFPRWRT